jgi:hypothetical protein
MNATADAVRAPRLTDKLLNKDLPVLLQAADDEVDYLTSRLNDVGVGAVHESLQRTYRDKRESLQRAREWLARKIAAETHHRTDD